MLIMADMQLIAEPGVPSVVFTSEFDAPRDLVFRAYMEPELLVQWLGPRRLAMTIDRQEVRDGGRWRFINRGADGNEFGFHGVFHGEPSPDETVRTFEYEGAPGHVSLEKLTLEERDGRTLVRTISVFQSVEDRDAMVQSGMERGVREGVERLEVLLARLTTEG
jgi:uncharacterized protein YndB with AHSA1/START domain